MRKAIAVLVTGLLAVLALSGCSQPSGSVGPAVNKAATAGSGARMAAGPAAAPAAAGKATTAPDDGSPVLSTAMIRTAEMTVAITGASHVADRADRAEDIATRSGGEIDSDDRTSGAHATATLRLRVPPEQLHGVLHALSGLGTERSRTSSATDVSERVADVTSRVASARESIARLRSLFDRAQKVADVIAVESELSTREADLESLEAQQRSLSRQTAMAAVTLYLVTAAKHPRPAERRTQAGGFVGGLERGWHGFVAAAGWVAAAVGTLAPFLVLVIGLAGAARLLGLRLRRRRAPDAGAAAPPVAEP